MQRIIKQLLDRGHEVKFDVSDSGIVRCDIGSCDYGYGCSITAAIADAVEMAGYNLDLDSGVLSGSGCGGVEED